MSPSTDNLIAQLAEDLSPVTRLAHPLKRLLVWLTVALPVSLVLGALVEQQHLSLALTRIEEPRILLELSAIFATALTAGYAALSTVQPGRSQHIWLLPVLPFLTWLSLVGESCLQLIEQIGLAQFSFAPHWSCYPSVVAAGFAPALLMVVLVNCGAVLRPTRTIVLGTLAASALGAVGLRLYHPPDATVILLLWQFIATVTFSGLVGLILNFMVKRHV
jgi:hypothetical protein